MVTNFLTVITKQEAIEQGLKHYFTGKPCKFGHIEKRNVANNSCRNCSSIKHKIWADANKEKLYVYNQQWFEANKEITAERNKNWYSDVNNLAKKAKKMRDYYSNNQDTVKENVKLRRINNPHIERVSSANKRATKLQRTPCWLSKNDADKIKDIYKLASVKSKETGVLWHVDHIIPLRGKNVSGLHVPHNLRVVPASENLRKSNKWDESITHQTTKSGH